MRHNTPAFAMGEAGIGYLFLCLSVKFLGVDLLPNWVGYLLILLAVQTLSSRSPALKSLLPWGAVLGGWEGVLWLLIALGKATFSGLIFLGVLVHVLGIYFQFQLFTELSGIFVQAGLPQQKTILWMRTVCTILFTVTAFPLVWEGAIAGILRFVCMVVGLWICAFFFIAGKQMRDHF